MLSGKTEIHGITTFVLLPRIWTTTRLQIIVGPRISTTTRLQIIVGPRISTTTRLQIIVGPRIWITTRLQIIAGPRISTTTRLRIIVGPHYSHCIGSIFLPHELMCKLVDTSINVKFMCFHAKRLYYVCHNSRI